MLLKRLTSSSSIVAFVLVLLASACQAGTVFLGPTPYLSAADSPFPVDGSNPNFFLEDFEDGLLNTPGIELPIVDLPPINGITAPSPTTDSVDGDDGIIDGSGTSGWALRRGMGPNFNNPPTYSTQLRITFSRDELGFLPNAFGFVWTDGPQPTNLNIFGVDENGNPTNGFTHHGLGDAFDLGETDEDRFFGFIADRPLELVIVSFFFQSNDNTPINFHPVTEIDHIQYGLLVPEPTSLILVLGFFSWFIARRYPR